VAGLAAGLLAAVGVELLGAFAFGVFLAAALLEELAAGSWACRAGGNSARAMASGDTRKHSLKDVLIGLLLSDFGLRHIFWMKTSKRGRYPEIVFSCLPTPVYTCPVAN
jgi:hypothetical protein